eukprot:SAG31_NODE_41255_length_277_cov_0.578652_1_plen_56_part_01
MGLPSQLLTRIFNMVVRYEQCFQDDQGTQGALPESVFSLLKQELGVRIVWIDPFHR